VLICGGVALYGPSPLLVVYLLLYRVLALKQALILFRGGEESTAVNRQSLGRRSTRSESVWSTLSKIPVARFLVYFPHRFLDRSGWPFDVPLVPRHQLHQ
jgi:hypothetical protein